MDEQRLWAPWRMSYIAGDKSAEATGQTPIAWLPGADGHHVTDISIPFSREPHAYSSMSPRV